MKDVATKGVYQIQTGDTITIFEIGGENNIGDESYEVWLCKDKTCADAVKVGDGFGKQNFEIY